MKILTILTKKFSHPKKQRGQVFILATLIIVVYTVSMIAVVTELSVNRTQTDQIDLPHLVNEYLSEMNYQIQMGLYNYTKNASFNQPDIITNLQSFISFFVLYATSKGVGATINLRLNEFSINAYKNSTANTPNFTPGQNFNETIFLSVNSSILFQSSDSGSKISGIFNNYYGVNMFIAFTNQNTLMLTQRDASGNIINYLSGAKIYLPTDAIDNNNGNYTSSTGFDVNPINVTLSSGLNLVS